MAVPNIASWSSLPCNAARAGSVVGGYATAGYMTNCLFERTSVVNTSGPGTNVFYVMQRMIFLFGR